MLRVSWIRPELHFPAILSTEWFRMMLKLTMCWITFPFGLQEIFLSLSRHGRSDCHFIAVANDPSSVYVMICWGNAGGDI